MDSSILIIWTSPFVIQGVPGVCFYVIYISFQNLIFCVQIVKTLIISQNAASDLGLHCLSKYKWNKKTLCKASNTPLNRFDMGIVLLEKFW